METVFQLSTTYSNDKMGADTCALSTLRLLYAITKETILGGKRKEYSRKGQYARTE